MIGAGGAGRPGRRRQSAQAGPGPRRTAHHRRHHLGRIQEILREGCRPGPPLPGGQGRGARRDKLPGRNDARPGARRWKSITRCASSTRPWSRPCGCRTATSPAASCPTRRSACSIRPAPRGDRPYRHAAGRRGLPPPHRAIARWRVEHPRARNRTGRRPRRASSTELTKPKAQGRGANWRHWKRAGRKKRTWWAESARSARQLEDARDPATARRKLAAGRCRRRELQPASARGRAAAVTADPASAIRSARVDRLERAS